jgi:cytochrome c peroxidase
LAILRRNIYLKSVYVKFTFEEQFELDQTFTLPGSVMLKLGICGLLLGCLIAGCSVESRRFSGPSYLRSQYSETPTAKMVALGQRLFFAPELSGSGRTACATCHSPDFAYSDPRPVSISDDGRPGSRHAPSLLNVALRPRLMWDGRFGSLEEQAFAPFEHGEMGIGIEDAAARISRDPGYRGEFVRAFGQPPSPDGIVRAVAAFERTLVIGNSRFDRFVLGRDRGALSPLEQDGFDVFTTKGRCVSCHVVFAPGVTVFPLLTDFGFRNLGVGFGRGGLRDPGRSAVTFADADYGTFRTPSLRNVAVTSPYMHDGSLRTLEEVIGFYDAGGRPNPNQNPILRPLDLTDRERDGLVAFLLSLTDLERR